MPMLGALRGALGRLAPRPGAALVRGGLPGPPGAPPGLLPDLGGVPRDPGVPRAGGIVPQPADPSMGLPVGGVGGGLRPPDGMMGPPLPPPDMKPMVEPVQGVGPQITSGSIGGGSTMPVARAPIGALGNIGGQAPANLKRQAVIDALDPNSGAIDPNGPLTPKPPRRKY